MTPRPAASTRSRHRLVRGRGDRGSATLELVVVLPVVLLLVFGVIQGAVYYYARAVALAAAQEGLREARAENGTASAGARRAREFLTRAGDGLLIDTTVVPTRGPGAASVTVRGRSLSLIPGMPGLVVSQNAAGPVERLTTPGGL